MNQPVSHDSHLIAAPELHAVLASGQPPVLLDIRFTPGLGGRKADYLAAHIPGALYADLPEQLANPALRGKGRGNYPLPAPARLQEDVRAWGIDDATAVVVYDDSNSAPAARAWWTLRWAGLRSVKLLNGGLAAWRQAGLPLEQGEVIARKRGDATVRAGSLPALDADEVLHQVRERRGRLLDARQASVFSASAENGGHIPGACNIPAHLLLDESGRLPDRARLRAVLQEFTDAEATAQPTGAYCGGGIAAALLALAFAELGQTIALYPGSWSEWTADASRPVEG